MRPTAEHAGISMTGETMRKLTHLLALVLPVGVLLFDERTTFVILFPTTLAALAADVLRARSASFSKVITSLFGSMMRDKEVPEIGNPVIINGATWTLLSMTTLLIIFPASLAVLAYSLAMIGDAFAAMAGRTWGKHSWGRLGRPGCTLEGSAAYLVSASLTAFLLGGGAVLSFSPYSLPLFPLFAGSLVATLIEISPLPGNDNMNAPVFAALSMLLIYNSFYGFSYPLFPLIP